jgi:1,4-alpha-glucan branching enzyme
MLYLDYDRKVFETNIYGNNYNLEAISFLKSLNTEVFKCYPDALMIAEESTAFANVSKPVYMNGLGFNFKWNMGWMNDTLGYMQTDMLYRKHHQNKLTFSIVYAFSENFILPISHDEVVHLKKSLLEKMPGSYYEKFANNRAFYGYMMTHPGKKLNFMGTEIGQSNEWNYNNELDWNALKLPKHKQLSRFTKEMNKFYLKNSCLWELDVETGGFEWINGSDSDHNMFIYKRINKRKEELIVIINFAGVPWYDYKVGVAPGNYTEVFNSDKIIYGGSDLTNDNLVTTKHSANFFETSVSINIAALSFIILKINKGGETNV